MTLELDDEGRVLRVSKFGVTILGHVMDDDECPPRWRVRWAVLCDEWCDAGTRSEEVGVRLAEYRAGLFRSGT